MGPTNETQERRERSVPETQEQASPQKGGPWSALMTLSVGAAALGIACGKGSGQADANVSAHYTPVGGMTADSLQLESLISIAREAGLSKLVPVERESTFSNRSIESRQALRRERFVAVDQRAESAVRCQRRCGDRLWLSGSQALSRCWSTRQRCEHRR